MTTTEQYTKFGDVGPQAGNGPHNLTLNLNGNKLTVGTFQLGHTYTENNLTVNGSGTGAGKGTFTAGIFHPAGNSSLTAKDSTITLGAGEKGFSHFWGERPSNLKFDLTNSTATINNVQIDPKNVELSLKLANSSLTMFNDVKNASTAGSTLSISDLAADNSTLTLDSFAKVNIHSESLNGAALGFYALAQATDINFTLNSDSASIASLTLGVLSGKPKNDATLTFNILKAGELTVQNAFIGNHGSNSKLIFNTQGLGMQSQTITLGGDKFHFDADSTLALYADSRNQTLDVKNLTLHGIYSEGKTFIIDKGQMIVTNLNSVSGHEPVFKDLLATGGGNLSITSNGALPGQVNGTIAAVDSEITLKQFKELAGMDDSHLVIQDGGKVTFEGSEKVDFSNVTLAGNANSQLNVTGVSEATFVLSEQAATHSLGALNARHTKLTLNGNGQKLSANYIGSGVELLTSEVDLTNFESLYVKQYALAGGSTLKLSNAQSVYIEWLDDNQGATFANSQLVFDGIDQLTINKWETSGNSALDVTGAKNTVVSLNDVEAGAQIRFVGGQKTLNVSKDVDLNSLRLSSTDLAVNILNGATLTISGEGDRNGSDGGALSSAGIVSSMSSVNFMGQSGQENLIIKDMSPGSHAKGNSFTNLNEVEVSIDTKNGGSNSNGGLVFAYDRVKGLKLTIKGESAAATKYVSNLNLGDGVNGGSAEIDVTGNHINQGLTFNVSSSASSLTHADDFAKVSFEENNWKDELHLQKGGWLAFKDLSKDINNEDISVAIAALTNNGQTPTNIITVGSSGAEDTVKGKLLTVDGTLGLIVQSHPYTNDNASALVQGDGNTTVDVNNAGFYLVAGFDTVLENGAVVKVTENFGDWSKFEGANVGANNIFTEWKVETDENGNLSFKLDAVKSVTEALPSIIPSEGFEEILGKGDKTTGTFTPGLGIGLVAPSGDISVGSILVGAIMEAGTGDVEKITQLANTYTALSVSSGAQAGAMSASSMVLDSLDRHYSLASTTGFNPMQAHRSGNDIWVDVLYRHDETRSLDNGASGYGNKMNLRGLAMGADSTINPEWTVGAVAHFVGGRADTNKSLVDLNNEMETYGATVWAGWMPKDDVAVKGSLSFAHGTNDLESTLAGDLGSAFVSHYEKADKTGLNVPDTIGTDVRAKAKINTVTAAVNLEKRFDMGAGLHVVPHAGIRIDHMMSDKYTMRIGGIGAVQTDVEDMTVVSVPMGVAVTKTQEDIKTGWHSRVMADAYVTPRLGDTDADVTSRFYGYNAKDKGSVEVLDEVVCGVRVGAAIAKKSLQVGFSAGLEGADSGTSASANVNVMWKF